mgnify:CR=1 FL=1
MYKIISGFLFIVLSVAISIGGYKIWSAKKENIRLSNELAETEQIQQETKSAWSVSAKQVSDLEVQNKELQNKIKDRDEQIAVISSISLKWKDQYFKIKNASQVVVDNSGNIVEQPVSCDVQQRLKISFEQEKDIWKISGFCLSSPPEAEISIFWLRPLNLSFILTKKNNQWKLYLDSDSPDIIAVKDMNLKIDPSIFEERWYEKIFFGGDIMLSNSYDPVVSLRAGYAFGSLSIGPSFTLFNGGKGIQKAIGVSLGWNSFKNTP